MPDASDLIYVKKILLIVIQVRNERETLQKLWYLNRIQLIRVCKIIIICIFLNSTYLEHISRIECRIIVAKRTGR